MSLDVEVALSDADLYRYFAARNCEYSTFYRGYTRNTPTRVEDCVDRCRAVHDGEMWLPLLVTWDGTPWAFHHLWHQDRKTRSTCVSGATFGPVRRPENADLRRKAWKAAVRKIQDHFGFHAIHGYCIKSNPAGVRWTLEDMECVYVGTLKGAVTLFDGSKDDIVCNTVNRADVAAARTRFEELFPGCRWARMDDEEGLEGE